jgi:hypothetical protein
VAQAASLRRHAARWVEHDPRRIAAADPPDREERIISHDRPDADHDRVDPGPQPMKMIESRSAVDVFGIAGQRGDPPVERLPELGDHEGPIGRPGLEGGEQSVQDDARRVMQSTNPSDHAGVIGSRSAVP